MFTAKEIKDMSERYTRSFSGKASPAYLKEIMKEETPTAKRKRLKQNIKQLEMELQKSVDLEWYEEAARIRDLIKQFTSELE